MPNDYTLEPLAATYAEINRQIAITLPEKRNFDDLIAQVEGLLREPPRVDYHILAKIPALRLFAIQVAPGQDVVGILERLNSRSDIVENAEQNRPLRSSLVVNDPLYWDQWALGRIGAEPAWTHALSTLDPTAPGVIVAVIDSGIHTGHPDLTGHLWDDGAGHHGFNLLTLSSDVSDAYGHGTQLAGTIGAISNNATGIAAAEWPIRLMAVKFLDVLHPPNALSGAVAIWWAVLNRAQVITAAWGVGIPLGVLRTAISFASLAGVVVIAAAGNDGLDNDKLPTYPASYGGPPNPLPNVVSAMASDFVSRLATGSYDDKAWFSNYGKTAVHLAAPGVRILSTASYFGKPTYREYSGTSAACAHVSYAAALLRALNPAWTPTQIREHLVASVDKSPWLACVAQGRLSLDRAVRGPFVITSPQAGDQWQRGTNVAVTWNNTYQTPLAATVGVFLSQNNGPYNPLCASGQPNNGVCIVMVPPGQPASAKLKLQSDQSPGLYAESGVFTVQ